MARSMRSFVARSPRSRIFTACLCAASPLLLTPCRTQAAVDGEQASMPVTTFRTRGEMLPRRAEMHGSVIRAIPRPDGGLRRTAIATSVGDDGLFKNQ